MDWEAWEDEFQDDYDPDDEDGCPDCGERECVCDEPEKVWYDWEHEPDYAAIEAEAAWEHSLRGRLHILKCRIKYWIEWIWFQKILGIGKDREINPYDLPF